VNDAEYEAQKARVEALFERWVGTIGLGWWRIQYVWHREESRDTDIDKDDVCMMDCRADWRYLHATINVYLPSIAEVDDTDYLEYLVVHELMHIFLCELRDRKETDDDDEDTAASDHEERVATVLAKAMLWARDAGMDAA